MGTDFETANPYAAPQARVDDMSGLDAKGLYVVAPRKFLLMMIGTLGLYALYWFYKNWELLDRRHKQYWPIARAIFAIFFTHALFREVDGRLRDRRASFAWSPEVVAAVYVVSALVSQVCGRLAGRDIGSPNTDIVSIATIVPEVWALYVAQRAINAAEGDPAGSENSAITAANFVWLVLGGLLWTVTGLGMYMLLYGPPS